MEPTDRREWLLQKLLEECLEVRQSEHEQELLEECADVLEVLLEIVRTALQRMGTQADPRAVLEQFRQEKEDRNGRFRDGVILQGWIESVPAAAGKSKSSIKFPVNYSGH